MVARKVARKPTAAARKPVRKAAPARKPAPKSIDEAIVEVLLDDIARKEYYKYGVYTIEDRAIFGDDGLKPVARKVLWAAHKLGLTHTHKADKSAKVVGETMAMYHPHGDTGTYGAIVTAAKSPVRLFDGEGNWGTLVDNAAAMRYTNMRLSKYSDLVFFDRFYLPTIDYVPNYDGSTVEPLLLPNLLPNALLNGNFGIAPGVNTRSPSYSLDSVIELLKSVIASEAPCTRALCMKLVFTTKYGGKAVRLKTGRPALLQFYRSGQGSVKFMSVHTTINKANEIRFDEFAPIADIEKTLTAVEGIKGVSMTRHDGDKKDKHQVAYVVQFVKSLRGVELDKAIKAVEEKFSSVQRFSVQITKRYKKKNGTAGARLKPTTVPRLVDDWVAMRLELERKACTYWIDKRALEIADLELMRLAVKMRDFLIKALSKKCTEEELAAFIAKGLKITVVQANRILDLRVRQLRALEDAKLVEKIADLLKESKTYDARRKNPAKYVLSHLEVLHKALSTRTLDKKATPVV
jgi:DNA gyrase/topoisomerase IV subunit A